MLARFLRHATLFSDNHPIQPGGDGSQGATAALAITYYARTTMGKVRRLLKGCPMELNRNQFLLIGFVLILLGLQLRSVDTYVLSESATRFLARQTGKTEVTSVWSLPMSLATQNGLAPRKRIRPPRWIAWAMISVGGVLVLHSLAMKKPGA